MSQNKTVKKNIRNSIFTLILPLKKQFIWVVILSLLGTGTSLIEPLIYREAINDVAGVFVSQARDSARKEAGLAKEPHRKTKELHHKGKVAPRTPQQALEKNTVIVIAHRFSMVRDADHVIVLDEGKVIESGRPAALISSGGWFSEFSKNT